jgi:hypothetical protein
VRVTDLLTTSDVTDAGFEVVATEDRDEPGRVSLRAVRGGAPWVIGVGVHGEAGAGAAYAYFRDVLDALADGVENGVFPERMRDLGDEAVYADGWLYVRRRAWVFWVSVEGPDSNVARDTARRLARPVLSRVDALPAPEPARAGTPVPRAAPPVPRPREEELPLLLDPRPRRRALVRHWRALVPGGADRSADMVRLYDVPGRSHDAAELLEALRTAETVAEDVPDTDALLLAVWFHAAVLDRSGAADPAASARLAQDELTRAGVRPATVDEVSRLVAAGDRLADIGDNGRLLALVLPCQSDTASTLRLAAAVLRPETSASGSYPRGHVEHVRVAYEGGGFVVVDDRGREHRFTREGDDSPGSLGVVVRAGLLPRLIHRTGPPHVFVMLDRAGRLLARDRQAHLWAAEDVDRFATATGLSRLTGPIDLRRKWGRGVVRLDTRGRRVWLVFALMVALTVVAIPAGVAVGLPIWLAFPLAIVGAIVGIGVLLDRALDMVKKGDGAQR